MTRHAYGVPCTHGLLKSKCIHCKRATALRCKNEQRKCCQEILDKFPCEACGLNHRNAKEVHHLATEFKRFGRSQDITYNIRDLEKGLAMVLCPTCHVLFHGFHGGKNQPFPLYTKYETIQIIQKERNPKSQSSI